MRHLEFAIEPQRIRDLRDLKYLESRFGFSKGALISNLPTSWYSTVAGRLYQDLGQVNQIRLTQLLKDIKAQCLYKSGRNGTGEDWLEIALQNHEAWPFHRIIEETLNEPPVKINCIDELGNNDFEGVQATLRDAQSLADTSKALLIGAEKVTIVDPYLCPSKVGSRETLLRMMRLCEKQAIEFHIFCEDDHIANWSRNCVEALNGFKQQIPNNIRLLWSNLQDDNTGFLHRRMIFTGKGGLVYDRGFAQPNDHDQRQVTTPVMLMESPDVEQSAIDYNLAQLNPILSLVNPTWFSK